MIHYVRIGQWLTTNKLYVAIETSQYSAAAACGGYLDVTGPRGTVRVKIVDQCPNCSVDLDLSREAFARIADPKQGIVAVSTARAQPFRRTTMRG